MVRNYEKKASCQCSLTPTLFLSILTCGRAVGQEPSSNSSRSLGTHRMRKDRQRSSHVGSAARATSDKFRTNGRYTYICNDDNFEDSLFPSRRKLSMVGRRRKDPQPVWLRSQVLNAGPVYVL